MLTDRDKQVLDFEARGWKWSGSKEQAIRRELGIPVVHYYQALNALLDNPDALAYRPSLVWRLRRVRDRQRRGGRLER